MNEEKNNLLLVLLLTVNKYKRIEEEFIGTTMLYQLEWNINHFLYQFTNNMIPKIHTYYEDVVCQLNSTMFRQHFRMSRETFEVVLNTLGPHWQEHFIKNQAGGRPQLSLEKNLLVALWALGTPDSYRSVAEQFGIGKSSVYACVKRTVFLVNSFLSNCILWPNEMEKETSERHFRRKCGFPQVIGAIDGCHIPIKRPTENGNDYFNRKKFYSLVLQGICDSELHFIDVDCQWPGSVHDARVFRTSPIYERGEMLCQPDYFVVADAAYPCRGWLLSPFKDNGLLTRSQMYYNQMLSKTRVVIENAFALLKGRFRRLKYLEMYSVEDLTSTIICCCILHNICLGHAEDVEALIQEGREADHGLHEHNDFLYAVPPREDDARQVITNYLWHNRR